MIQILPTLGWGDAVGNDTRAIHRILKEEGYDSVIAAEAVDARIPKEEATEIGKLPEIREVFGREEAKAGTKLAVEVEPLRNFYPAEEYHQKYLDKNPGGYCHIPLKYMG